MHQTSTKACKNISDNSEDNVFKLLMKSDEVQSVTVFRNIVLVWNLMSFNYSPGCQTNHLQKYSDTEI